MKWLPSNVGAEPKKVAFLGGLIVLLAVVYFINQSPDGPPAASAPATKASPVAAVAPLAQAPRPSILRRPDSFAADFKPSMKLPEDLDVSRIDPSLHLDLIARLQNLPEDAAGRSVFDFGAAPAPPAPPPPKVDPIKPGAIATGSNPNIDPPAPVKPPVPPIPLKFYGYVNGAAGSTRQAFFLQGEDIFVARENDMIQNRYRIVRIGINSAVVEDTQTRNQQTIPLVEEQAG